MPLTRHGKRLIAQAMFHKGKNFLAAAVLLHQKDGYRDVILHLLCQGLEIIQKGLLLAHDYDKFGLGLKKLGHDLVRGSDALHAVYAMSPLKKETKAELESLSNYYRQHLLRYGTINDVLGGTDHLQFEAVLQNAVMLIAHGNKIFQ